jgi:hypothetical protein
VTSTSGGDEWTTQGGNESWEMTDENSSTGEKDEWNDDDSVRRLFLFSVLFLSHCRFFITPLSVFLGQR